MEEKIPFGEWTGIRYNYLVEEKPELLASLQESGELEAHLQEIEDRCTEKLWDMVDRQMEREGINDEMKNRDLLGWLGNVNNIRARMKEVLIAEICQ